MLNWPLNFKSVNGILYRVYQNDWSGFEVDYIHKYGEQNYKYRVWQKEHPDLGGS